MSIVGVEKSKKVEHISLVERQGRYFFMEYEIKHYCRIKLDLLLARNSFLKEPPKNDYEEYARKVIGRAYFIILNKIDELDGTNERLMKYYKDNIEKCIKK